MNIESKRCLITGIGGMDGSFLAELLLSKGYEIHGFHRRSSQRNFDNIQHLLDKDSINLIEGDLTDQSSLIEAVNISRPDLIFNMGAQSYVGTSWKTAQYTIDTTGMGLFRVMEAVRHNKMEDKTRILQASSSEMFGDVGGLLNENSPMRPRSPYGCAKVLGHNLAKVYRDSYKMWVSCSIGFNHSGIRRSHEFVTRKISMGVANIAIGLEKKLVLGNVRTKRDWSDARDIVNGMWLMMKKNEPDDYVLASGESHSIREVCEIAFRYIGLDWEQYTVFDKALERPADIDVLVGDSSKARKVLGWQPKIGFKQMIEEMVEADINMLKREIE